MGIYSFGSLRFATVFKQAVYHPCDDVAADQRGGDPFHQDGDDGCPWREQVGVWKVGADGFEERFVEDEVDHDGGGERYDRDERHIEPLCYAGDIVV